MAKVHLELDMPDSELLAFARALHAWDDGRTEITSTISVTHTKLTKRQVVDIFFYRREATPDTPNSGAEKAKPARMVLDSWPDDAPMTFDGEVRWPKKS